MRKLKVYTWIGNYRNPMPDWVPRHQCQSSEIIATTSMKRAAEIYCGGRWSPKSIGMHTTGNDDDIAAAMEKPHTVLWQPNNAVGERTKVWYEGESDQQERLGEG